MTIIYVFQSVNDYEEVDDREKKPNYEQKKWEEEQMSSAVFHFGAKRKEQQDVEYDLVLDSQIDFIQALSMPGTKEKVRDTIHIIISSP